MPLLQRNFFLNFSETLIADYNNNQLDDDLLISSAATAALATHDYTNRSLANAAEDRCFPCTYQGCVKVNFFHMILIFLLISC